MNELCKVYYNQQCRKCPIAAFTGTINATSMCVSPPNDNVIKVDSKFTEDYANTLFVYKDYCVYDNKVIKYVSDFEELKPKFIKHIEYNEFVRNYYA